ncbi:MAG: type II secretion system F family protein [Pirellulales bacterium]|nr:type II secretion system F family protein [Pirellulales bacterium]
MILSAADTTTGFLPVAASLLAGLAAGAVGWMVWRMLRSDDLRQGDQWRYDVSRVNELRRIDPLYRIFQPAIQILARLNRALFGGGLAEMQREIQAAGLPRFWLAEEYLARAELIATALAPVYVYFLMGWMGAMGVLLAGVAVLLTVWLLRHRLATRARHRLREIKRRMPFLLDLLTLLMEAGSTFLAALRQAVEEFRDHPVGEEFGRVMADMNLGKTRAEAFGAMRDRLSDDEITSIIGSILQGEQLGTPLANIFRTQSDVLRIKRTQRAETAAGEAGVNMLLPGVLVMLSTVLIILGPFLLNYLAFGMSL